MSQNHQGSAAIKGLTPRIRRGIVANLSPNSSSTCWAQNNQSSQVRQPQSSGQTGASERPTYSGYRRREAAPGRASYEKKTLKRNQGTEPRMWSGLLDGKNREGDSVVLESPSPEGVPTAAGTAQATLPLSQSLRFSTSNMERRWLPQSYGDYERPCTESRGHRLVPLTGQRDVSTVTRLASNTSQLNSPRASPGHPHSPQASR